MEDLDLLEQIISAAISNSQDFSECDHREKRIDKGVYVCLSCGFTEKVNDGQTFTSHKMYKRSSRSTSISTSLQQKGFDQRIIDVAQKIYDSIIDEDVKRTGNRSGIICACIFQAFKYIGEPVDYSYVYKKYDIQTKSALKGLKYVSIEIAKKKSLEFYGVISSPISPENFIVSYMNELKAPAESMKEVLAIYDTIKNDREIGMSRPQSIAAGVIFFWLKKNGMTDAMKIIEEKAHLSQITITKKAKVVGTRLDPHPETEAEIKK